MAQILLDSGWKVEPPQRIASRVNQASQQNTSRTGHVRRGSINHAILQVLSLAQFNTGMSAAQVRARLGNKHVSSRLNELCRNGLVDRFDVNGKRHYKIKPAGHEELQDIA